MSKIILTISIFIFCAITINAQSKEPSTGTALVSGTITSNGQPVRGARITIRLQTNNPRNSTTLSAKSDPSGNYLITGLKAGKYFISVSAPPLIHKSNNRMGGTNLNISDGDSVENMNFELVRGGVITGAITGPDGQPLVEAMIDISKFDDKGRVENLWSIGWEMRRTDDRGMYRVYGLLKGRYLVSAGIKGQPGTIHITGERQYFPKTFYGDTDDEAKAKVIEIDETTEATDIDIKIKEVKKFQKVHGRITDIESGAPVSGLQLSIGSLAQRGENGKERVTASGCCSEISKGNGEFTFNSVLPGKYAVFYRMERSENNVKSPWDNYYSEPAIIEVKDSDLYGVEVKMHRGSTISGNIVVEGSQNDLSKLSQLQLIAVTAIDKDNSNILAGNSNSMTKIRPDGSFIFNGVSPGKIHIRFNWGPDNTQFMIDRIEYNGKTIAAHFMEGIELTPGSNISGVRVILHRKGTLQIHGEIKIINGNLPADIVMAPIITKIRPEASNIGNSGGVDARKKFIVNDLSEGEYEVTLRLFSSNGNSEELKKLQDLISRAKQTVTVTAGSPPPTVVLTVDLGAQNQ